MELNVESILEGQKTGNEDEGENKNREPLRRAQPIRVAFSAFITSFAASPGRVKGIIVRRFSWLPQTDGSCASWRDA